MNIYHLEHIYSQNGTDETKFIGIFSSFLNACNVRDYLIKKTGFKDHPQDCFRVRVLTVDYYEKCCDDWSVWNWQIKSDNIEESTLNECFYLEFVIETEEDEDVKKLGVFSSYENAQSALDNLRTLICFSKYPEDLFSIHKIKLDNFGWTEGFISWKDALISD